MTSGSVEYVGGGVTIFLVALVVLVWVVLTVCWILLPLFVLGTNKRLDRVIAQLENANWYLSRARVAQTKGSGQAQSDERWNIVE